MMIIDFSGVIRWILKHWYRYCRSTDIAFLWPACRELSIDGSLDQARKAFAWHAFNDDAWLFLGEEKIKEIINNLE